MTGYACKSIQNEMIDIVNDELQPECEASFRELDQFFQNAANSAQGTASATDITRGDLIFREYV
ncbi:hypothetical protein M378DRAFT_174081 [Amanita muscaria Koide BX008]|uniref:Uncharacterized protein n=1 Tax=Amanita muscaria (strain Koide BX008) TaxID=946122 RepID=A0A0C2SLG9_AMAMK|nr:hypothetical protein M378DRAFT_174081 [Amanita muscaria Koide BX008]